MDKHEKRLDQLTKIAYMVDKVGSGRLASSVWYANDLVSIGRNQLKTHPLQKKFSATEYKIYLHAEVDAISKAVKDLNEQELKKATLYVARAKHGCFPGMAMSCSGCASCAYFFGIKKIYYTTGGKYGEISL